MYYALSAYGIANNNLEISLRISELIKDAIIDSAEGQIKDVYGRKCINSCKVSEALRIAGLRVTTHYYYRWCIEEVQETEV